MCVYFSRTKVGCCVHKWRKRNFYLAGIDKSKNGYSLCVQVVAKQPTQSQLAEEILSLIHI